MTKTGLVIIRSELRLGTPVFVQGELRLGTPVFVQGELRLGTPVMKAKFFYTYIIQSSERGEHFYSGFTEDLDDRLKHHNSGAVPSTAPYCPWRYKTVVAFTDRDQALAFERYLKTQSGRVFAKKRL